MGQKFFKEGELSHVQVHVVEALEDVLLREQAKDPTIVALQEQQADQFSYDHGLLYKTVDGEAKLVVPESVKQRVMADHHDTPSSGHLGVKKTLHNVARDHWWPTLRKDVQDYV